jgi:hypothetical protein
MPPTGALRPGQINIIGNWIEQGADWPDELANEADSPALNPKAVAMVEALRTGDRQSFMKSVADDPKFLNARGPEGSTPFMYAVPEKIDGETNSLATGFAHFFEFPLGSRRALYALSLGATDDLSDAGGFNWPRDHSKGLHGASQKSPPMSGTNRWRPSIVHSSVSLDRLQAGTAARVPLPGRPANIWNQPRAGLDRFSSC